MSFLRFLYNWKIVNFNHYSLQRFSSSSVNCEFISSYECFEPFLPILEVVCRVFGFGTVLEISCLARHFSRHDVSWLRLKIPLQRTFEHGNSKVQCSVMRLCSSTSDWLVSHSLQLMMCVQKKSLLYFIREEDEERAETVQAYSPILDGLLNVQYVDSKHVSFPLWDDGWRVPRACPKPKEKWRRTRQDQE